MQVADITTCGWNVIDGILSIDWDSEENRAAVNERVLLLTKGCQCKTGCTTGRCGCRRKGQSCSEGCACLHCSNLPNVSKTKNTDQDAAELDTEENRGQMAHVSDGDREMQLFLQLLLAPASDSDSESASDTDNDSKSDDEMLSYFFYFTSIIVAFYTSPCTLYVCVLCIHRQKKFYDIDCTI